MPSPDDMGGVRWVVYEPVTLDIPCTDVRRLDVGNMTFHMYNPALRQRLELRFQSGTTTHGNAEFSTTDWTSFVTARRGMTLSGGSVLRFVEIADEHNSSTTLEYVFLLSCRDGKVRQVFEAGGEGLFLDHRRISGDTIRLRWGVWRKGDSHAQPSRERIQDFAWVPSFGQFAKVHDEERAIRRPGQP